MRTIAVSSTTKGMKPLLLSSNFQVSGFPQFHPVPISLRPHFPPLRWPAVGLAKEAVKHPLSSS